MVDRYLDLETQFANHAVHLLQSVDGGRAAHGAGNIVEAGAPFEHSFRETLSTALPDTLKVVPGYFFNSGLALSKQVDTLVCDQGDMLQFAPARNLTQRYVPYSCVRVVLQLKNGASCLGEALEQSAASMTAWREQQRADSEFVPSGARTKEPLSLVLIGREGSDSQVRKALSEIQGPLPAYVLLLEQGLLYGKDPRLKGIFDEFPDVTFSTQGNDGPLNRMETKGAVSASGRMLLWFFFAIITHLKSSLPDDRAFKALKSKIERDCPLRYADEDLIVGQRQ
ncbi:MAG: hypothetical protein E6K53_12950 [Gammaproteobacteria bacterium]|nr:MAG: hypothetical protein E6K53_12950 [Gammaproteobacteria bacterium]